MLVLPLPLPAPKLGAGVALAPQLVLVDHEPVEPDRTPRVNLVGADADLRAEAVAHAVGEARRRVPVRAGAVHGRHEPLGLVGVRREDGLGVVRAVRVDVQNGIIERLNDLDGERQGQELGVKVLGPRVLDVGAEVGDGLLGGRVALEDDALLDEGGGRLGEDGADDGLVHEERLETVTRGGVVGLGVHEDLGGHVRVRGRGDVGGAEAVGVAQDGDLGALLDEADELVGAAGDDEVDVAVEVEELGDDVAGGDELDGAVGDL